MVQLPLKSFPKYPAIASLWAVLLGVALVQLGVSGTHCIRHPACNSHDIVIYGESWVKCSTTFLCIYGYDHQEGVCNRNVLVRNVRCNGCQHTWDISTCPWTLHQHKKGTCPKPGVHGETNVTG
ncbi:hypothetical protein PGT21_004836 [Puccinia graminis f. sp. tritici]|uniref:Uncharacterized protein n=1 Tax=Puccinia graminis f. sp. tritici TaxID=56615 RepID=A0A5B0QEM0_PUCGR|nr:hypothetical protein PGT21_004836 [Puccinia graminis f. sp. tritici]